VEIQITAIRALAVCAAVLNFLCGSGGMALLPDPDAK
jgi:hypothetical protein